jgi:hypothetical protein
MANYIAIQRAVIANEPAQHEQTTRKGETTVKASYGLRYMTETEQKEVFSVANEVTSSILAASLSYFSDWVNATPHAINIAKDVKAYGNTFKQFEKDTFEGAAPASWSQAKSTVRVFLANCPEALQGDKVICTTDGDLTPLRVLRSWIPKVDTVSQTMAEKVDEYLSQDKDSIPTPNEFLTQLVDNGTVSGMDMLMQAINKLGEATVLDVLAERQEARRHEQQHLKVA